jgi:ABC-2 type transport system ATP-binding protein
MIEFSKVTKAFGRTTVLDIDHLVIHEGTSNVIVGPNGAGKSTLLLLLVGLTQPTTGSILVGGAAAGSRPALGRVSFAPDHPALFDDLTLGDQLHYVARLSKRSGPAETCLDLIDAFDAADLLERFPRSMSKGQRQKSSLLVATARPFEILLLDEPTTGLDGASGKALIAMLATLAEGGRTVVSSSHNPDLVAQADRQIYIEEGRIGAT